MSLSQRVHIAPRYQRAIRIDADLNDIELGPAMNYGPVPTLGKAVLCLCMIAGRLEIFALFAVFSPECWRR